MEQKKDIKSMSLQQLTEELVVLGEKKFRAAQIYGWMHQKLVTDFEEMTNISKNTRKMLREQFELVSLKKIDCKISAIDGTRKYLFGLSDGHVIESVLMKYNHGNSVCISSQVGCRMGCRFCASTLDGLSRNLRPSEMLDQIYQIQKDIQERVSNVVVMGSGEPLDNYDNLLQFIHLLTDANGLSISQRNVTVSTCGLVPQMHRLADEKLQITLALSLHASNNDVRKTLMPIANRYLLSEVLEACDYYFEQTGRRMTFEYSLVKGVNDGQQQADELAELIGNRNCHINLIPVNPIKERNFVQTDAKNVNNFKKLLEKKRINVTIRREMGRDIDGACGQLRKRYMDQLKEEHSDGGVCADRCGEEASN
ncbi:MAG: 23S rRNA (adenine(2503)-C(2))-methyltransferase RlmN [Clostridiales bacterium]|nr:23S rRNA (adenine(2503)-C(2))-methyltransferase RlmN [Clostridiales bacterium]